MNTVALQARIDEAWERRDTLDRKDRALREAVEQAVDLLDGGAARVAEPAGGGWKVNEWLKKAVLLYFRVHDSSVIEMGRLHGFDKVPLKYTTYDQVRFANQNVRVVPPATVRRGAYVAPGAILMPSFVNIGAWVGPGTMVDTWATVGSCAQIGANVHLSGGVGIGGVLEPLQANPTIIEDDCFIGARSEVVEGVVVERGSAVGMGVFLGQSTKIYDRASGEVSYGRIPAGSVVVAGSLPAKDGSHSLYAAVIVKQVDEKTRAKTGINELLRSAE